MFWDVMKNDATLFMHADQVEAASRVAVRVIRTDEEPMITPSDHMAGDQLKATSDLACRWSAWGCCTSKAIFAG